jgi:chloramphenicol O-acetyltransferase type A
MRTAIDTATWIRKDHYEFFTQFEEPFFGITANIDCTVAYQYAKDHKLSFFLYYLYRALKAANSIENFRYRIVDKKVYLFDVINASPTINRPDGTFGFSYMNFNEEEALFYEHAKQIIEKVTHSKGLVPAVSGENVIHFSALPWINFTSVSHARSFTFPDSSPKISFGKMTEENGNRTMAVSVHMHHGLADGYHVGLFYNKFQELMNCTE